MTISLQGLLHVIIRLAIDKKLEFIGIQAKKKKRVKEDKTKANLPAEHN